MDGILYIQYHWLAYNVPSRVYCYVVHLGSQVESLQIDHGVRRRCGMRRVMAFNLSSLCEGQFVPLDIESNFVSA